MSFTSPMFEFFRQNKKDPIPEKHESREETKSTDRSVSSKEFLKPPFINTYLLPVYLSVAL